MSNFQKFNNKQLSEAESTKVMGGDPYHLCIYGDNECYNVWYTYYNINCGSPVADPACHNNACAMAQMDCEVG